MKKKKKFVKEILMDFLREERKKLEEGSIKETQGQEFSRGKEWSTVFNAIEHQVEASDKLQLRDILQNNWRLKM